MSCPRCGQPRVHYRVAQSYARLDLSSPPESFEPFIRDDQLVVELGSDHCGEIIVQKQEAEKLSLKPHSVLLCPLAYFRFLHEVGCCFPKAPRDQDGGVASFYDLAVFVGGSCNVEVLVDSGRVASREYAEFRKRAGLDGGITAPRR